MKVISSIIILIFCICCNTKKINYHYEIVGKVDGAESIVYTDCYDIYNDTIFVTYSNGYCLKVTKPFTVKTIGNEKDK